MMFENDICPPQSRWSVARDHLPLVLLVGGAFGVFFGLHVAASGVVVVTAIHLVVGLVMIAVRWFRRQRRTPVAASAVASAEAR